VKRGNTALKRGLGLASVFALAIAGAVVAAPAASAAAGDSSDAIRATPAADANYVNAQGIAGDFSGAGVYGASAATGTAKVLKAGATQQLANDFQIVVPANTTAGNLVVTLPAGITFAAPPVVTVDTTERVPSSFNSSAGFAGNNAHLAQAVTGGAAISATAVSQPTVSTTGAAPVAGVITSTLSGVPTAPAGAYLVSFQHVLLNIDSSIVAPTEVVATLSGALTGATTLGYVSPLTISAASGAVEADASGNVTLPSITVSEAVKGALGTPVAPATTVPVVLTISGGTVDGTATVTATTSGDSARTVAVDARTATTVPLTVTGTPGAAASVTVSGIKLTGVAKNADIKVSVTSPATGKAVSTTTGATGFSQVPSLVTLSTTITTAAPEPRIAGADRYATAADIAALGTGAAITAATPWKVGTTNAVVIANGETVKQGVDALAANYLAAAVDGPILLTTANSLPTATQAALIKLFKGYAGGDINVYVMGKADSVSAAVQAQIKSIITSTAALPTGKVVNLVSVAGDNRYQTSASAATTAGASSLQLHSLTLTGTWQRTAFLASGTVNADALAAGSVAVGAGIPVLLTNGTALDQKVQDAIKNLGITQVIVLGATDRVSAAVVDSLKDLGVTSTTRIAGANRYETSAALYTWAFNPVTPTTGSDRGLGWGVAGRTAYVANGTAGFPDALSVGPLAGSQSNPILTTAVDKLSSGVSKFLTDNKADFTAADPFFALGQSDRISSAVITAVQDALK